MPGIDGHVPSRPDVEKAVALVRLHRLPEMSERVARAASSRRTPAPVLA